MIGRHGDRLRSHGPYPMGAAMKMRHPLDHRVHFSELKEHAKSPAHVKLACQTAREMTRPMMVGAVADSIVFGQRGCTVYPGKVRAGKEWQAFKEAHPFEFLPIDSEFRDAMGCAKAVRNDPRAAELLEGCEYQLCVDWDARGLECGAGIHGERGGLDCVHMGKRYVADLKITSSTEPGELARHAFRMYWHAQGVWYLEAAEANWGKEWIGADFYLIAVESSRPHNVTCLRLSEASKQAGAKLLTLWTEQHRQCEASGLWPGYTQSIGELEPPEWVLE